MCPGWLIVFGLNGPLRQYFSLYWAVSQREGKRREEREPREKNVQTTHTRTYWKHSRPLPCRYPYQQDAPALKVYPAPSICAQDVAHIALFIYITLHKTF